MTKNHMRKRAPILLQLAANMLAIYGAHYLLPKFTYTGNFGDLAITAAILTAINLFIRPIVKLILTPFIILSLGLLIIGINAAILYILDMLQDPLTIESNLALLLGTILISAFNIIIVKSARHSSKKT